MYKEWVEWQKLNYLGMLNWRCQPAIYADMSWSFGCRDQEFWEELWTQIWRYLAVGLARCVFKRMEAEKTKDQLDHSPAERG